MQRVFATIFFGYTKIFFYLYGIYFICSLLLSYLNKRVACVGTTFDLLVDSAILEEVFDQHVCDGVDDKPHVVGVGDTRQMAISLWSGFFLLLELLGHILDTWVVLLWSGVVRECNCDWGRLDLFLNNIRIYIIN
jgi:hypothetical protein